MALQEIPIVYLWVDGSDKEYKKKYSQLVDSRNRDNDDLKYSLRSLETYLPWWKGKLYIVTDNQRPWWLIDDDNIIIIPRDSGTNDKDKLNLAIEELISLTTLNI